MKTAVNISVDPKVENWEMLCAAAKRHVEEFLQQAGNIINVAELSQYTTLKLSIGYLFPGTENTLNKVGSFQNIQIIGKRINELWIASKKDDSNTWENELLIHEALKAVITPSVASDDTSSSTRDPLDRKGNPMNFLLPAYETMWRVVMRCLLEIRYRGAENGQAWSRILRDYIDNLQDSGVVSTFRSPGQNGTSALDIVKEALRLYPPSRRIHREFDSGAQRIDIEKIHRSKLLGQDDPLVFRPERWQSIGAEFRPPQVAVDDEVAKTRLRELEEELGFMPFAFRCPAGKGETRGFGWKMIALLVGVISDGLDSDWELKNGGALPQIGTPLASDREAYTDLELKRRT
ncbi:uncharacterized protein BDR25DRAFT_328768 [Lindgomyces ingoldianus]|uniref:Uncharacterized protein n=1 Tax=Lindgomyces ingoldianus TaxID=673940 RepID=A0ACB6QDU6_9PLEO|nr:uncharacterized protein BDR25DRAFT_328768 [Lindgomyces ingoldianus]KAF2465148.1 hypothetical protein BDR25DRAFT_328768 [Lindgomyces ingoldianus]